MSTGLLRLSHVAVRATDVEASVRFYRDFLGFPEVFRFDTDEKALQLVILAVSPDQWIEVFDAVHLPPGGDLLHQVAFRVADCEALRARLASLGHAVPAACPRGRLGNAFLLIPDPNGYTAEFVQYGAGGWPLRDADKSLPDARISDTISHAGVVVRAPLAATDRFYRDTLGLTETWRGTKTGDAITWINLGLPGSDTYLELMLEPAAQPHFCLSSSDVPAAVARLESRAAACGYARPIEQRVGRNRRRQANLFDPAGVRVELMEPTTIDGIPTPPTTAPLPGHVHTQP
jgi:lactoylglutathione lyase